ncbi:MAG TPA: hypothetical protein ENG40_03465 [Thermoprotei archaeon]|nr:hypothetical protein [Thermoprotei archaeon]
MKKYIILIAIVVILIAAYLLFILWNPFQPSRTPEDILNELYSKHPSPKVSEKGEPPIHIIFVLHIEPCIGKSGYMYMKDSKTIQEYNRVKQELLWLTYFCSQKGVKMTALFNGWYMQIALRKNDLKHLTDFLKDGHEIGTHAHNICYDKLKDAWHHCNQPDRWFADAKKAVDDVLSKIGMGQNRVMSAMFIRGKYAQECSLMQKYGYDIGLGNRPEIALNYFGHVVWNPWRASCVNDYSSCLVEDHSTPFISIDHRAQIGSTTSHGGVDSRSNTLKRQFLMLFLEWKVREAYDIEDKMWSWGVVHHPNYGSKYHNDIEDFFTWLNKYFVGKQTIKGNIIAVYSTASQIADEYYSWEKKHPGRSSFSYMAGEEYPYYTEFAKNLLLNSEYNGEIQLTGNVIAFLLKNSKGYVIVLWNRGGGIKVVDLSKYFSGDVKLCTPWGNYVILKPDKIPVGDIPLIVVKS